MARGFRSPFRLREHLDSIAKDGEKIFNQWKSRKRPYYRTKWWLKRADQFVAQNISLDSFHARDQPRH